MPILSALGAVDLFLIYQIVRDPGPGLIVTLTTFGTVTAARRDAVFASGSSSIPLAYGAAAGRATADPGAAGVQRSPLAPWLPHVQAEPSLVSRRVEGWRLDMESLDKAVMRHAPDKPIERRPHPSGAGHHRPRGHRLAGTAKPPPPPGTLVPSTCVLVLGRR